MAVHCIDGVGFRHSLSKSELDEAVKAIALARLKVRSRRALLRDSIATNDTPMQLKLTNWLVKAPEALLVAAVAANKKLPPAKRQSLETCCAVPSKLNFAKPIDESVYVRPKPKKDGTMRAIYTFGLLHRSAQVAIASALAPHFKPRRFQYTHLGVHRAIAEVKRLLEAGYVYSARLDIKDHFSSFNFEKLAPELPLEKGVVEHTVLARWMKVAWRMGSPFFSSTHENLLQQARLGIPTGSGCPPIVSMLCISRLVWHSGEGWVLLNYADDFLVLAKSPQLRSKAVAELTKAVKDLPGGTFKLQLKAEGTGKAGFEFLGHCLVVRGGEIEVWPSTANFEEFYSQCCKFDERLCRLANGHGKFDEARVIQCLAQMFAYIKGWRSAFRECTGADRVVEVPILSLEKWANAWNVTVPKLKAAVEPWMEYTPDDYALNH